jgi:hypothetical protein
LRFLNKTDNLVKKKKFVFFKNNFIYINLIGASDKLMEGKSTFFIEMEETNNAMKLASKHSLIIMVKNK